MIAGTLEGFISPIEWWPLEGKLAVSGLSLVFLIMYLRGGRVATSAPIALASEEPAALALSAIRARRAI